MKFFVLSKLYQNIGGFSIFSNEFYHFVDNFSQYLEKKPKLKSIYFIDKLILVWYKSKKGEKYGINSNKKYFKK